MALLLWGLACAAMVTVFAGVALSRPRVGPAPIPCVRGGAPGEDEPPACPVQGRTVVVRAVSGVVFVTVPGGSRSRLGEARTVPMASIIDATHGRYRLTADERTIGIRFATADFYGGAASVAQGRGRAGATLDMRLAGSDFSGCAGASTAKAHHRAVRGLWGNGKGHLEISGRYAAAVVRGTNWHLSDFCDGSGVTVRRGAVAVNDFATGETVLVDAGHSFFAPAAVTFRFPVTCPAAAIPLGGEAMISGVFTPAHPPAPPLVDYMAPSGAIVTHTLTLDAAGRFVDHVPAGEKGTWSVTVHLAEAQPHGVPASCSFSVI